MIDPQATREKALGKMNEIANANRSATLDEFRELLIPEVVAFVAAEVHGVPVLDIQAAVERSITVVANRLALDFDQLAEELKTFELNHDTERPE